MLKAEQAEQLKNLGLDPDLLKEAFTSEEEKEITLPTGKFYSDESIEQLKENVGKESAKKGANTLLEMQLKEIARENEFNETPKTIESLLKLNSEKVLKEANLKPNEKVESLTKDLDLLRSSKEKELSEKEQLINELRNNLRQNTINAKVNTFIPNNLPDGWTREDLTLLFNSKYNLDTEDNKWVVKDSNGEILKDDLRNPLSVEVIMQDFLKSKGILSKDGRGDGDDTGATATNLSAITSREQFNAYLAKQGWKSNDPRALEALIEVRKNPNFK